MSLTSIQLQNHCRYITGSKMAGILGLEGAYQTKFQLFAEMKGYTQPSIEDTERMKAGWYMEDGVARYAENEWGWKLVQGPPEGMFHPDYPFIYGLIDRLQFIGTLPQAVIEIKWLDKFREKEWIVGPPDYFKSQLYLYMSIYDLSGRFAVCFGGNHFDYYDLPQNPEVQAYIIRKACEFWDDLQNDHWPEVDGSDNCSETLKKLFASHDDQMVIGDQSVYEIAEQYKKFSLDEKQAKENKELASNKLKEIIGNNQRIAFADGSKVTWKMTSPKKVKFNEEQFEKEYPDLYHRFCYLPKGYRRMDVRLNGGLNNE